MSNRDSIIDKIRKLRRMTEASGASETEALMAAAQVAKLMASYNVEESELRLRTDSIGMVDDFYSMPGHVTHFHTLVAKAISAFTHTKLRWKLVSEDVFGLGVEEPWIYVKFYGYPLDVEAAIALSAICQTSIITETERWEKANPLKGKGMKKRERDNFKASFFYGICERLSERVKGFGDASTGRGLIVLKNELVDKHYAEFLSAKNIALRVSRARDIVINNDAYLSGRSAAENVDLGRKERIAS